MVARTVLTTGANSGIGLATTLEVARRGFTSVGSVRSAEKADLVATAAAEAGLVVETVLMDVTDADASADVVDRLRPWAVVNNAGYAGMGAIEDVDDEEARQQFETMVLAPMRLARLALPHMRDDHGGRIVNVSSIYGRVTTPLTGWYQATKHALEALSDALRQEVAGDGIAVVLVEPGGFKTGIWDEAERDVDKRERAGTRFGSAYRRSLAATRLTEPIMGQPSACARVIGRALTTRTPRPRYLVGIDAQLLVAADRVTPTMVKDRLSRLSLGL